jgi:hypothetical protein
LARYTANPDTSTLKLVGELDSTTWIRIFDILQDKDGVGVIFGIHAAYRGQISVQVEGQLPEPLFPWFPNDQIFVCFIPKKSKYAIVHLHNGEVNLYTSWKNHRKGLKLTHRDMSFSKISSFAASSDYLGISLDNINFELKLSKLPETYKDASFELKPMNSGFNDAIYLQANKLHFRGSTVDLRSDGNDGLGYAIKNQIYSLGGYGDKECKHFFSYSDFVTIPLMPANKFAAFFSTNHAGRAGKLSMACFSLPTKNWLCYEPSYPFICWMYSDGSITKIYLFVIPDKY